MIQIIDSGYYLYPGEYRLFYLAYEKKNIYFYYYFFHI